MELAFLGCGNMGGALLRGALEGGLHRKDELVIYHPVETRREELGATYEVATTGELGRLGDVPRILVGVKPYQLEEIFARLGPELQPGQMVISVVAGLPLAKLTEALGRDDVVVIRAMPNTPAQTGGGVTAWCASENASDEQLAYIDEFFTKVGTSVQVPENLINPLTALCGSGPAYILMVIEALADAAVREGVPRVHAEPLAVAMIEGTARMARQSGLSAADLRTQVTSPAGTTAAGCAELEHHGLRAAFLDCLRAANERARELGS